MRPHSGRAIAARTTPSHGNQSTPNEAEVQTLRSRSRHNIRECRPLGQAEGRRRGNIGPIGPIRPIRPLGPIRRLIFRGGSFSSPFALPLPFVSGGVMGSGRTALRSTAKTWSACRAQITRPPRGFLPPASNRRITHFCEEFPCRNHIRFIALPVPRFPCSSVRHSPAARPRIAALPTQPQPSHRTPKSASPSSETASSQTPMSSSA